MLILHIGTQKTGSSSIQHFLRENEGRLREQGINFVSAVRNWIDHNNLARELRGGDLKRPRLKEVLQEIESQPDRLHIISAEELFHEKVPNVLSEHMPKHLIQNTRVVVYLRRPDKLAEALYKQRIKAGRIKPGPKKFINEWEWEWDYLPVLKEYSNLFGFDSISARPYERTMLESNDIVCDFLKVTEIPDSNAYVRTKPEDNPTFSNAVSELMGFCALNLDVKFFDLNERIARLNWPDIRRNGDVFTKLERLEIMDRYRRNLDKIAEDYSEDLRECFICDDLQDESQISYPNSDEQARLYRQAGRAVVYALKGIGKI